MNNHSQGTLSRPLSFNGPGLHTAGNHFITLLPAKKNSGILFRKVENSSGRTKGQKIKNADKKIVAMIPATWKHTKPLPLCTCIADKNNQQVRTIEHLLSAFYACGIDNIIVEIEGHEVPILDGSARPFIEKIDATGVIKQEAKRPVFKVEQVIEFTENDRSIRIEPADALYIDISISLAKIGQLNWNGKVTPELFKQEMGAARTFGRLKSGLLAQLTRFSKDPICLGATTKSAVVIVGDKAINKGGLRMPDEYIRHRVLDLVGDLMLSGGHIHGKITASSTAHRLNHGLLRAIFDN